MSHHRVVVIGAGFGGIGASIALADAGIEHVVLERAADLGGTWRDNRYPGCRCDVPSHLYSFSFALNPDWSETYSTGAEIQAYLRDVAERFGVVERIRFGTDVHEVRWNGGGWDLRTTGGALTADIVLLANGPLAEPAPPDVPGLDTFGGTMFHTAGWPDDLELTGRRVGVIGTGSSAVQLVPEIQPEVRHLSVFQRTPAWVLPFRSRPISERKRQLYRRLPSTQRAVREGVYLWRELIGLSMLHDRTGYLERAARRHLEAQVADPVLRAALTPSFHAGCKRLLLSDDWYPALQQPNVRLVSEKVVEVVPSGVVTADGAEHSLDTLVLGTGFRVLDNPMFARVRGTDGRTLAEHWRTTGARAYLGTSVPGFPNLFQIAGPNTGIGHTSLLLMIEAQLRYIVDAVRTLELLAADRVEVRPTTYVAWDREMRERSRPTVWASGTCASWYLDAEGRNGVIWPDRTRRFRRRTRRFDPERYEVTLHTTTWVPVDGAELAVSDVGTGPAVVLAHGWTERREVWAAVAQRLVDAGHRVVLYDQRGHGSSSGDTGFTVEQLAADLRAVLEATDVRDAVLAGHSMGGMAVLALAAHHPSVLAERVSRLVLVSTGAAELGRPRARRPAERVLTSPTVDRVLRTRWGHLLARSTLGRRSPAELQRFTRDLFVSCPPATRAGWLGALWDLDLRPSLPTITTPTVVVSGTADRVTPPRLSEILARDIPGARLVSLPGLGHQLPIEAPDTLAELLDARPDH